MSIKRETLEPRSRTQQTGSTSKLFFLMERMRTVKSRWAGPSANVRVDAQRPKDRTPNAGIAVHPMLTESISGTVASQKESRNISP